MSVNYIGLIAPMIEADKELKQQNDGLRAQLASVKAEQDGMKTAMADMKKDIKGLKGYTGYGVNHADFGEGLLFGALMMAGMGGAFAMGRRRKEQAGRGG
jgi:hypothetical protein